jgi:fructosamine-3-kinase
MSPELQAEIEAELGQRVAHQRGVSGGDINQAFRAELEDGTAVFVKTHPRAPKGAYAAEAAGLEWLKVEGGPTLPTVLGCSDRWLLLEWVDAGESRPEYDEELGRQLARMHLAAPEYFGLEYDNFIANLPQSNRRHADWASFFGQERVLPLVAACTHRGVWTAQTHAGFEHLVRVLPERVGEDEQPARLHGDLWMGNAMRGPAGEPMLIDPAVYGGHREVDLAMMKLFGGFSADVFAAYNEVYPLQADWEERVDLWQLYPLLVHALLFGGGYAGRCVEVMRRWG